MTVTDLSLVVPSRAHFGHERHCSLVSVIRAEANNNQAIVKCLHAAEHDPSLIMNIVRRQQREAKLT